MIRGGNTLHAIAEQRPLAVNQPHSDRCLDGDELRTASFSCSDQREGDTHKVRPDGARG